MSTTGNYKQRKCRSLLSGSFRQPDVAVRKEGVGCDALAGEPRYTVRQCASAMPIRQPACSLTEENLEASMSEES